MTRNSRPVSTYVLIALLIVVTALLVAARFTRIEPVIGDVILSAHQLDTHAFPVPDQVQPLESDAGRELSTVTDEDRPRNVVLIIGDGMGVGHLSTASVLLHGPHAGLSIESAHEVALVKTHIGDELVGGSAAAATALATGLTTNKGMISRMPDGRDPVTLFQAARAHGMATGIITNSGLVDATPAAFVAHADQRTDYRIIFDQMLASDTDLMIGGDWLRYHKAAADSDYTRAVKAAESISGDRYNVIRHVEEMDTTSLPMLALFRARAGSKRSYGPPLDVSTRRALGLLSTESRGLMLVIESEDTDESAHVNSLKGLTAAMAELDRVVEIVLEFARTSGDTLVLITADHDSGVPAVLDGDFSDGIAEVRWLTDGHAANWVPLFTSGPGSDNFGGVIKNTDIALIIADLLGFKPFPAVH